MPPDSEIVCPFCHARHPWPPPRNRFPSHDGYGHFEVYCCPCGAVASLPGAIGGAGSTLGTMELDLCWNVLQAERHACRFDVNYVTLTDRPMLMLWAKRRSPPPDHSQKENTP